MIDDGPPAGPAVGTAFLPEPEPAAGFEPPVSLPLATLARLPRRRRPGLVALAVALIGAGVLVSASVYQAAGHRVRVVLVVAPVPAGQVIKSADVGTASVLVGPGVRVIPAGQLPQVVGQVAGTSLAPGTLLAASELGAARPPHPGQVLVPVPVRPSGLPVSGLSAGDRVLVVATPGAAGQPGLSTAPVLTAPVRGVVDAVSSGPDADGYQVVDLLVTAAAGPALARQVSTGQFALVITSRRP
ncbi:MAG: SAF domain-containing protein [Streptosporangiaceae bacterium]